MFKYNFKYQSPSNMYKKLSNQKGPRKFEFHVNSVEDTLAKLKRETENTPKNKI